MKRLIYAAIAVTIILTGCEYHPFYDGQVFGVYAPNVGLIRTDGTTINVPIVDRSPYVLEFRERMMINGKMIGKKRLAKIVETVKEKGIKLYTA